MLSIEGALDLSINGIEAHVEARGDHLRLDVDRPRTLLRSIGAGCAGRAGRLAQLRRVAQFLFDQGLTLHVLSRNRQILVLGRDAPDRTVSRVLGVPHMALGRGADLMRVWAWAWAG